VVKAGKYGPYVTDGEVNATLPKTMNSEALTLDEAIALVNAKRASGGGKPAKRNSARKAPARAAAADKKPAAKKAPAKKPAAKKSPAKKSGAG